MQNKTEKVNFFGVTFYKSTVNIHGVNHTLLYKPHPLFTEFDIKIQIKDDKADSSTPGI